MSSSLRVLRPLLCKPAHLGIYRFGSSLNVITNKQCSIKTIEIRTCGKVYQELNKKSFLYRNSPSSGLKLDVNYADTLNNGNINTTPTVLALHGSPGSYHDFGHIINNIGREARIIAPNFPKIGLTNETGAFFHSTEEKCDFLNEFLESINVKEIDCLLMHSSSAYPGMKLWSSRDAHGYNIKSVALINPAGHRTIKAMKPHWFIDNFTRLNMTKSGRNLIKAIGRPILALKGVAVKIDNLDEVALASITMYLAKVERLGEYLKQLRESRTPSLYIYGENDKLVDTKISKEMGEILHANEENTWRYDEENSLYASGKSKDWLKVVSFKKGGHHSFIKNEALFSQEVSELLNRSGVYNKEDDEYAFRGPVKLRKVNIS